MPEKRIKSTASSRTRETKSRGLETAGRRQIRGNRNGDSGIQSLYMKARARLSAADIPEIINLIQLRTSTVLHSGEEKAKRIASQLTLLGRMVKERWDEHRDLPWRTVAACTVAVIYFVGPFDVIPDSIPFIGFLDDAAILALCFKLIQHDLKKFAEAEGLDIKAYGL